LIGDIRKTLLATPGVSSWPEIVALVERPVDERVVYSWDYPLSSCESVGGRRDQALPGSAAIFSLLHSILLVDDMLDEDPRGAYRDLGPGRTANLALALQAVASRTLALTDQPAERRAALLSCVARISLTTAYGQHLDVGEVSGEEGYWRVVDQKTPPLFGGALFLGAVLGGGSLDTAAKMEELGLFFGRLVQVSDDVKDALEKPASPDWRRRDNNLPILYATTADHPQKNRFYELLDHVDDLKALGEAQDILVKSGAISFCVYRMTEEYRAAEAHVAGMNLESPQALLALMERLVKPVKALFQKVGVEPSEVL